MQLAVNPGLAHTPRDELGVLGTEVEYEDFLVHGFQGSGFSTQRA
jgi:hypothetical protein